MGSNVPPKRASRITVWGRLVTCGRSLIGLLLDSENYQWAYCQSAAGCHPAPRDGDSLGGIHRHSDTPLVGDFGCSSVLGVPVPNHAQPRISGEHALQPATAPVCPTIYH